MSLLKIPLTIGIAWGFWISVTPPHKQEKEEESKSYVGARHERWFKRTFAFAPLACKSLIAAHAAAETLTILAAYGLLSPLSGPVLSRLAPSGAPDSLRITTMSLVGAAIAIAGALVRLQCYWHMGKMFTFEMTIRDQHQLVSTGPYAYVRHPSYTGFVMVVIGALLYGFSEGSYIRECGVLNATLAKSLVFLWTGWMCFSSVMLVLRTGQEDEVLHKEFGEQWDRWSKRVPWKLVPMVY